MANGIRTGDPHGFNKGRSSKFREGSWVRQTPEEGRRTYRPKQCGNNNKDEDNSPKNLNDKKHLAWIEHQFLSGIRDSRKARSLWGMMRGVGGVRKSIHHSWLPKRLGLVCWGFEGVQQEIPSEETSTLQIRSVAFPWGQYTSLQLYPCHRLFE